MRFLLFCLGLLAASTLNASAQEQAEALSQTARDRINFSNFSLSNNVTMFGIKGPEGTVLGTPYLDTTWQAGNVKFYNRLGTSLTADSLAGVPVRLDLLTNEVEVRAGAADIRAVKATAVKYVDMNNAFGSASRFINVHEYQGDAASLSGFFDQVAVGKVDLLVHPSVYIKRATFNAALNTGSKDDALIKKMDWYVARNKTATRFSPGKKAMLDLMADKKDQIEAFLKKEKPDLKTRAGLLAVFFYYNKL